MVLKNTRALKYILMLFLFVHSLTIFSQEDDIYYSSKNIHKNDRDLFQEKLKNSSNFYVIFSYKNTMIDWKYTEDEFIKNKIIKKDSIEDGAGKKWLEEWNLNRKEILEPLFLEALNWKLNKKRKYFNQNDTISEINILINVSNITLGQYYGVMKIESDLCIDVQFSDKENNIISQYSNYTKQSKTIVVYIGSYGPGVIGFNSFNDFSELGRLKTCYSFAAKELAKYLRKKL